MLKIEADAEAAMRGVIMPLQEKTKLQFPQNQNDH